MYSKKVNENEMKSVASLSVSDFHYTEFESLKNYQKYNKTEGETHYLLMAIRTDIAQNITLLLSGYDKLETANVKSDFKKLLFIPKGSTMKVMTAFDSKLFKANLDIHSVISLLIFTYDDIDIPLESGLEWNFNNGEKTYKYFTLQNKDSENDSIVIINLYRITQLFNEINEGRNFIFANGSPFPAMAYFPIEKYKMQTNLNLGVANTTNSAVTFEMKAYIVTDEWVKRYKYQRETTIVGDELQIQSLENDRSLVTFTDEKMNHPECNILITFAKASNDTTEYKQAVFGFDAYYTQNYIALTEGTYRGYTFENVDEWIIIRIENTNDTHKFYGLEFAIEPQENGKEINYQSTIEKYRDFPIHKTELQFKIEEERRGRLVLTINYDIKESFLVTIKPNPEEGIEYKKIKMLAKVISAETKEKFPTYEYNKIFSGKIDGREATLTFNTAFTSNDKLKYSKYIVKVCDSTKIKIENLYSNYYLNDTLLDCQHVEMEVENSATPVEYKFMITKEFDSYGISIIGHFIMKDTNEEVLLPYTPIEIKAAEFEKIPSTNFNSRVITGNAKSTFILSKNSTTASYFKIEFSYEAVYKKENILNFAVEKTTGFPTYQNDSSIILSCGFDQGKYTYIVNQKDESQSDIMISFWKSGADVKFIIKYISQDTNNFPHVTFKEDITAVISENKTINVEFYEVLTDSKNIKEAHYHLFIFSGKSFDGEDSLRSIDTIFTDMQAIQTETFESKLNGEKREVAYNIDPSLYSDQLYAALVFVFDLVDTDVDERVAFNYIKITDKKFEVK